MKLVILYENTELCMRGNFWSSWLSEDEVKRRERQETRRRKKKG